MILFWWKKGVVLIDSYGASRKKQVHSDDTIEGPLPQLDKQRMRWLPSKGEISLVDYNESSRFQLKIKITLNRVIFPSCLKDVLYTVTFLQLLTVKVGQTFEVDEINGTLNFILSQTTKPYP